MVKMIPFMSYAFYHNKHRHTHIPQGFFWLLWICPRSIPEAKAAADLSHCTCETLSCVAGTEEALPA